MGMGTVDHGGGISVLLVDGYPSHRIFIVSTGPHLLASRWPLASCQRPPWRRASWVPVRWTMWQAVVGFTLSLKPMC